MIKKTAILFIVALFLVGCAHKDLLTNCPNFGEHCKKTPINSWDKDS